jgi:hypothetical protein
VEEFDALYFNRKFAGNKPNNPLQSININRHMVDNANRLHGAFSIKTSKGYTTTSHQLKDYLKKTNDSILFPDITIEFLNSVEKHLYGSEINLSYSSVGVHMWHI